MASSSPAGKAQQFRSNRAQSAAKTDLAGSTARLKLMNAARRPDGRHPWGERAALIIGARKFFVRGQRDKADQCIELAEKMAPLTAHEMARIQRA
jgi:hypothetical protein